MLFRHLRSKFAWVWVLSLYCTVCNAQNPFELKWRSEVVPPAADTVVAHETQVEAQSGLPDLTLPKEENAAPLNEVQPTKADSGSPGMENTPESKSTTPVDPGKELLASNPFEVSRIYRKGSNRKPSKIRKEVKKDPVETDKTPIISPPVTGEENPEKEPAPELANEVEIPVNDEKTDDPVFTEPIRAIEDVAAPIVDPGRKVSTLGLLAVFGCILLLLTFTVNLNRGFLKKLYKAALNENFSSLLYRERKFSSVMLLYYVSYAVFFINGGLFLYLLGTELGWEITQSNSLLALIALVACVYVVRHLVLNIIAAIFPVSKELNQYNFNIQLFNILLGLVLVPVNLLLAFGPEGIFTPVMILGATLILLFYLFRQFRGLLITNRLLSQSPFHFFVYLCTIEILPVLILLKFF